MMMMTMFVVEELCKFSVGWHKILLEAIRDLFFGSFPMLFCSMEPILFSFVRISIL